jgi:RNA polymerase sigma-70 factor (ECF subfamily)
VQATLCSAVTKLHTFRGEAQLFTWLCTFCRHEISAYYRREEREQPEVALPDGFQDLEAVLDSLVASQSRPEQEYRRREIGRLVRVALDHLPPNYGNVLEWKYLDGLSVDEIAKNLKISAKAAESQLTRARVAFKEAFAVLCGGRSAAEMEGRLEA